MNQPRRTQAERSDQTRAAVIDAAVERIGADGFALATLERIAHTAGLSKGAVHHHFRAKHALVEPVLEQCVERFRVRVRTAFASSGSPGERLRRSLASLWQVPREGGAEARALAELLAQGAHDARVHRDVAAKLHAVERELGEALEAALGALGLRARVPVASLPALLVALLAGAALEARYAPGDAAREADALAAVEALALSAFTV